MLGGITEKNKWIPKWWETMRACTPSLQGWGWAPLRAQGLQGRWGEEDGGRVAAGDRVCLGLGPFLGSFCDKRHTFWWWSSQEGTCDPEFLWRLPILADEGVQGKPPCICALKVPPAQDSQYIWNGAEPYGPCRAPHPHPTAMSSTCLLSAEKL